jgi:hypothetical protein
VACSDTPGLRACRRPGRSRLITRLNAINYGISERQQGRRNSKGLSSDEAVDRIRDVQHRSMTLSSGAGRAALLHAV